MKESTSRVIHDVAAASAEGRMHFGQVIGSLSQAGVEAYAVDYRGRRTTYYLPDGAHCDIVLDTPAVTIGQDFDKAAIQAAIRGSQQGVVRYPEFKVRSMEAGCVGYTVWIAGRHVCYFGRKGEMHIERFPD
ncbi:MAG TPA: hypothetical protein VGE69_02055 [Pseudomonadales bacterium]